MSRCTFEESFAVFCNYNDNLREKDTAFAAERLNTFVFNNVVQIYAYAQLTRLMIR